MVLMQTKTVEQAQLTSQPVVQIEQGPGVATQTLAIPMTRPEVAMLPDTHTARES